MLHEAERVNHQRGATIYAQGGIPVKKYSNYEISKILNDEEALYELPQLFTADTKAKYFNKYYRWVAQRNIACLKYTIYWDIMGQELVKYTDDEYIQSHII